MNPTQEQLNNRIAATGQQPSPIQSTQGTFNAPPIDTKPATVSASVIGNVPPLNYPNTQATQSGSMVNANGIVSVPSSSDYISSIPTPTAATTYTPPPSNPTLVAAEQQNQALQDKLASLQGQEVNKSADTQQQYQDSGIFQQQKDLASLYGQIQSRTAQFKAAEEKALYSGESTDYGLGANAMAQRQAASEIGMLNASYASAQGQYSTAKAIADQAIDFKYAPIEQQISDTQKFLDLNKTNLSIGQQKQADIMQGSLALQSALIDQQKTDKKNVVDIMNTAAQYGADPATLAKIGNSSNAQEAINNANGVLSYDYQLKLYQQGIISQPPAQPGTQPNQNTQTNTPAIQNNNPGNLRDPQTGQFQQFSSMQAGYLALQNDLYGKVTGATSTSLTPDSTLLDFAKVYAPASDGNNPTTYAQNLASQLGVSPSTKIGTFKNNISKFADAVAKNEDINAYQVLKGNPPPVNQSADSTVKPTQTGMDFNTLKITAPPFISSALGQLESSGSAFINLDLVTTPQGKAQVDIWAKNHNIPILTGSQASDAKSTDEALRNIVNVIAPAWAAIAPTSIVQRGVDSLNYPFSKTFDTNFYSNVNTYANNKENLAQQISALSKSAPKLGLLGTAESALPDISGLVTQGKTGQFDTYKDGMDKLKRTVELLNQSLSTYIPGNKPVVLNAPSARASNNLSVVAPDGNTYTFKDANSLNAFKKSANIQ